MSFGCKGANNEGWEWIAIFNFAGNKKVILSSLKSITIWDASSRTYQERFPQIVHFKCIIFRYHPEIPSSKILIHYHLAKLIHHFAKKLVYITHEVARLPKCTNSAGNSVLKAHIYKQETTKICINSWRFPLIFGL